LDPQPVPPLVVSGLRGRCPRPFYTHPVSFSFPVCLVPFPPGRFAPSSRTSSYRVSFADFADPVIISQRLRYISRVSSPTPFHCTRAPLYTVTITLAESRLFATLLVKLLALDRPRPPPQLDRPIVEVGDAVLVLPPTVSRQFRLVLCSHVSPCSWFLVFCPTADPSPFRVCFACDLTYHRLATFYDTPAPPPVVSIRGK